MRVSIIGGIFDQPPAYRSKHSISPETILTAGLRAHGWQVDTYGHRQIPKSAPSILHVHHFGRGALRAAVHAPASPFVFTTHDPFAMNGLSVGWKRRLTDAFVLHRAARVVALSNAERDFLIRRYRLDPAAVEIIPNGIDTQIFDKVHSPAHQGREATLLFVGQLREFKGLDYLLQAQKLLQTAQFRTRLHLVYQTDALLDRYRIQAARLGILDSVDFAGPKTAAELARLYSSTTVFVSPSLGECLSTVVLEAMCCGAPVVATDVGGIREQLDPETGLIVPPRDPRALADAIASLLAEPARRDRLGSAARRKARAQFNVRQMIDRHVRLYEELLGAHERAA